MRSKIERILVRVGVFVILLSWGFYNNSSFHPTTLANGEPMIHQAQPEYTEPSPKGGEPMIHQAQPEYTEPSPKGQGRSLGPA